MTSVRVKPPVSGTEIYADAYRAIKGLGTIIKWHLQKHPVLLPAIWKQNVLRDYIRDYGLGRIVETGTYKGDTVSRFRNLNVVSIEILEQFGVPAQRRFSKFSNIEIKLGDSAALLPEAIRESNEPTLFWLDGHFPPKEPGVIVSPIEAEIRHIRELYKPSLAAILIDDARLFRTELGYPDLDPFLEFVKQELPGCSIEVKDDIIRVVWKR